MVSGRWVPIEEIVDRQYTRDSDGKFATSGGVRDSLANAKDTRELNTAIAAEAKRITGHDVQVDMAGADLSIAAEYGEGVLRGLERFPAARLSSVHTYGPRGARRDVPGFGDSYAVTSHSDHGDAIGFNTRGGPEALRLSMREAQESGHLVAGTPMGVAFHEMGHVVASQSDAESGAFTIASHASSTESVASTIRSGVSSYAATSRGELAAEAFADVMANGASASSLSRQIMDHIQTAYDSVSG